MAHCSTFIGQLLQLIPRHVFDHLVDSYGWQGPNPRKPPPVICPTLRPAERNGGLVPAQLSFIHQGSRSHSSDPNNLPAHKAKGITLVLVLPDADFPWKWSGRLRSSISP